MHISLAGKVRFTFFAVQASASLAVLTKNNVANKFMFLSTVTLGRPQGDGQ